MSSVAVSSVASRLVMSFDGRCLLLGDVKSASVRASMKADDWTCEGIESVVGTNSYMITIQ